MNKKVLNVVILGVFVIAIIVFGFIYTNKPVEVLEGMTAEQKIEFAKADAEIAKIKAESDREVAQIYAEITLINAGAEAEANRIISESITEALIEKQQIDKWDGAYPKVVGSDSTVLTDIG